MEQADGVWGLGRLGMRHSAEAGMHWGAHKSGDLAPMGGGNVVDGARATPLFLRGEFV